MRSAVLVAFAAVLAAAPMALAQDPPPAPPAPPPAPAPAPAPKAEDPAPVPAAPKPAEKPAAPAKHVNKVTDAAKAALEVIRKGCYDPVTAGLKEYKGKLVLKIEMEGMEEMEGMDFRVDFAVDFKAPSTLGIEATTDNPMLEAQVPQIKTLVERFARFSRGDFSPASDTEHDMDVAVEGDKKFLVIQTYEENTSRGALKLALGANGLPGKGVMTVMDPNMGISQDVSVECRFAKEGELSRIEKFVIDQGNGEDALEFSLAYVDAGGVKVMSGISATIQTPMGPGAMDFRYETLSVNGKAVELPKKEPKKKEEAKPAVPTAPGGGDAAKPPEGEKKPEEPKPEPKPEEKKEEPK